jgi:hypothetical protein
MGHFFPPTLATVASVLVLMSSAAVEGCTQLGNAIDGVNANDQAGWSEGGNAIAASADGAIVAVGAWQHDGAAGTDTGHVRVFQLTSGPTPTWSQLGNAVEGAVAGERVGYAVALAQESRHWRPSACGWKQQHCPSGWARCRARVSIRKLDV